VPLLAGALTLVSPELDGKNNHARQSKGLACLNSLRLTAFWKVRDEEMKTSGKKTAARDARRTVPNSFIASRSLRYVESWLRTVSYT
jgi:hypothetical protein